MLWGKQISLFSIKRLSDKQVSHWKTSYPKLARYSYFLESFISSYQKLCRTLANNLNVLIKPFKIKSAGQDHRGCSTNSQQFHRQKMHLWSKNYLFQPIWTWWTHLSTHIWYHRLDIYNRLFYSRRRDRSKQETKSSLRHTTSCFHYAR